MQPGDTFGKRAGTAAVLSFLVPGLGLIYMGHIGEGLLWTAFSTVLAGLALSLSADLSMYHGGTLLLLAVFASLAVWIFQIYRSYNCALGSANAVEPADAVERHNSGWVCTECGCSLLYGDDACPRCGSAVRHWLGTR